jgi:hypothetical protein
MLPASDLPEHMAQVAIWKHYGDPCHRFAEAFELDLATPYLLGYVVMRTFAAIVTVSAAAKITVWLGIMLLPLSVRALLMRGGGDPWLSLLGFPLAYGYSFYWGFLTFTLATPLAILYVALLFAARPRARTVVALLLMLSHALLFAFCAAVTMAAAIVRRSWRMLLPLVPGAILFAMFLLTRRTTDAGATWHLGLKRLIDFPSLLFANAWEPAALVLVLAMIAAVAIGRPRLTRDRARWAVAGVAALAYLAAPFGITGTAYLYPRFAILLAVALLFLFEGRASRAVVLAIVLIWMAVLTVRFRRFDGEARQIDGLLERIPAGRRVAQFNVHPFSEHVPGPVFWHYGALYQVRRGGVAAWSFSSLASWYPVIVRFRQGSEPAIRSRTTPVEGIDWPGVLQYDYLLVRGSDPRRAAFRDAPVTLRARSGAWWLFETPRARGPQRDCPPLNE